MCFNQVDPVRPAVFKCDSFLLVKSTAKYLFFLVQNILRSPCICHWVQFYSGIQTMFAFENYVCCFHTNLLTNKLAARSTPVQTFFACFLMNQMIRSVMRITNAGQWVMILQTNKYNKLWTECRAKTKLPFPQKWQCERNKIKFTELTVVCMYSLFYRLGVIWPSVVHNHTSDVSLK